MSRMSEDGQKNLRLVEGENANCEFLCLCLISGTLMRWKDIALPVYILIVWTPECCIGIPPWVLDPKYGPGNPSACFNC